MRIGLSLVVSLLACAAMGYTGTGGVFVGSALVETVLGRATATAQARINQMGPTIPPQGNGQLTLSVRGGRLFLLSR